MTMTTPARTPIPVAARTSSGGARRLILPLVLILGVGGLLMVLGVPWTSASEGTAGVRLTAAADQGAKLTITTLEPGDSVTKSVTIRNSGSAESRLSFEENANPTTFAGGELHLTIEHDGVTVYDGQFGAMNDVSQDVGSLPAGGSSTFTFTVSLPESAPYANQGDPAVATYTWTNSN
ncbi:hypothetical protein [Nocardioides mangrovi]|uniref:DUF4352 domain-containing protein n=1 Tax=Nocardioides mangrovi TaxID=2874580 RepID=A0ABS7UA07_9ACTN|nr:hypothetical protein [Nocardioides mangrovi]MBZ5737533.1 hypothetical protein [Nocardioides mangrovi]